MEDLVGKKRQKFQDIDIESKLKRRQGELDKAEQVIGEIEKEAEDLGKEI